MNKNILIVLGGAIFAAILVAVLVQFTLGGKGGGGDSAGTVEILVAAKDLKVGDELSDGALRWQEWPESAVFRGAVRREDNEDADEVVEGRLRRDVSKDEAFLKSFLLKEAVGNFVANSLDPGKRAMAIEVDAKSMVGGFIKPGDYVDVVLTYKHTLKAGKGEPPIVQAMIDMQLSKFATETILQRVRVLAIDQTAENEDDEDDVEVAKTVTLEVSAHQAEKLALGSEYGKLVLTLRGVGDDDTFEKDWPTVSDRRLTSIEDEVMDMYNDLAASVMKHTDGVMPAGGNGQSGKLKVYNGTAVNTTTAQ